MNRQINNVLGLLNLHENEEFMKNFTRHRILAAIPFAGRYRIIDFILSSMVNSGVQNVGVLVPNRFRSIMDHLRSGKEWDLDRKQDGLFLLPPSYTHYNTSTDVKKDLEHIHNHLDYIQRSKQEYVLIAGSQMVSNVDFRPVLKYHLDQEADVTVLYKSNWKVDEDYPRPTMLRCQDGRVVEMELFSARGNCPDMSMNMYLLSKSLLIQLVENCMARGESDFARDGIIKNLGRMKVCGYPYEGYVARISSIQSYYHHSMEMLQSGVWHDLFNRERPIYTKVKDEAPAKYMSQAQVTNSLVANGCIIDGIVENCILFRGVRVAAGAHVKNSIIMQKTVIQAGSTVENVVCDKEVRIRKDRHLKGELSYLMVVEKRMVI